jgi:hypothetical protein
MPVMAQRAFISRTTLFKLKKGDPGVAIGTYSVVLFVLGMIDRLATSQALSQMMSALHSKKSACRRESKYVREEPARRT